MSAVTLGSMQSRLDSYFSSHPKHKTPEAKVVCSTPEYVEFLELIDAKQPMETMEKAAKLANKISMKTLSDAFRFCDPSLANLPIRAFDRLISYTSPKQGGMGYLNHEDIRFIVTKMIKDDMRIANTPSEVHRKYLHILLSGSDVKNDRQLSDLIKSKLMSGSYNLILADIESSIDPKKDKEKHLLVSMVIGEKMCGGEEYNEKSFKSALSKIDLNEFGPKLLYLITSYPISNPNALRAVLEAGVKPTSSHLVSAKRSFEVLYVMAGAVHAKTSKAQEMVTILTAALKPAFRSNL